LTARRTPQNKLEIRDYRKSDFARLYEIDHAAFPKGIAYSHLELQHYIRSRKSRTLVAEDDGDVIGFVIACSEPRQLGHIITIDVAPHRQREQIGSRLLDQIEHIARVAGVDHVGLGSDFDGTLFMPEGVSDVAGYPTITAGLLARGWPEADLRKLLGENTLRVLADATGPLATTRRSPPHGPSETPQ